jgi:intron-binding protein aquarius
LQYLTLHDYLLRNYELFRYEAAYEIKNDVEDAVTRLDPQPVELNARDEQPVTSFHGWSKHSIPINSFLIVDTGRPNLGETRPSHVYADVVIDIGRYTASIRKDWDNLRKGDTLFLLTIRPRPEPIIQSTSAFRIKYGIEYMRVGYVHDFIGIEGRTMDDRMRKVRDEEGVMVRTFRLALDTHQFALDRAQHHRQDPYTTFNILLKRTGKENNFRQVLDTIRGLMEDERGGIAVVPEWLRSVFLGYGLPSAAHYSKLEQGDVTLDLRDTFLDKEHVQVSFPHAKVEFRGEHAPFKLTFSNHGNDIVAESYYVPSTLKQFKRNQLRFTPFQVEAIRSGCSKGLTLAVGPPGSGKTDVAVQIVSNLYHSHPHERILLVTHSNQALNQLFSKIVQLDVEPRHLLRLGRGEEDLQTEESFGKAGRIQSFLVVICVGRDVCRRDAWSAWLKWENLLVR